MQSNHRDPINLGQDRMISINELVDIVSKIAGKRISKRYDADQAAGSARPQQRQHAPARSAQLGAAGFARGRIGDYL